MTNPSTLLNECPKCGAEMSLHNFLWVCDYCGYAMISNDIELIDSRISNKQQCLNRMIYIQRNIDMIATNSFVNIKTSREELIATSTTGFSPNDGRYHLIKGWTLFLTYSVNEESECLLLRIKSVKEQGKYFAFLLDNKYAVAPIFIRKSMDEYWYGMTPDGLYLICLSNICELSGNIDDRNVDYNEFVHYCRRFYNIIFDRSKFSYSLRKKLLTDNIN